MGDLALLGFGPDGWGKVLLRAGLMTVAVSVAAFLTGLVLGTLVAWARVSGGRLTRALAEGAARWQPLIESWPTERFDGVLSYTTTRGQPATLPFAATLAHVFNHGTHHRGQITAALTALGQPGPELDLVYMLQEEQGKQ